MAAPPTLPAWSTLRASGGDGEFFGAVNVLFETAEPLQRALAEARPSIESYEDLIERARRAVAEMSPADRLLVINAHPRIGARPSDAEVSALSRAEQGMDREEASSELEAVYARLGELNAEYERRFGFRFVVFVNGRSKKELIPVLERRLGRARDEELAEGLEAMMLIASDRLKKLRPKL